MARAVQRDSNYHYDNPNRTHVFFLPLSDLRKAHLSLEQPFFSSGGCFGLDFTVWLFLSSKDDLVQTKSGSSVYLTPVTQYSK